MRSMSAFISLPFAARRRASALVGLAALALGTSAPVRAADSFSFVQLSDTQIDGSDAGAMHTSKLRDELHAFAGMDDKPAFILDTGSVTQRGTAAQFAAFRQIVSADLPKSLPLYAVPGSGDVRWGLPAADAFQAESGQPRYRSFDYGGVHFILLDTTVPLETLGHIDQVQMTWLQSDLAKIDKKRPLIVCFHHTAGQQPALIDNQQDLFDLLRGFNMRLYLCGQGQGQGQSVGNINGVPVVTTGPSFNGAYNLVKISKNKLEVYQRIVGDSQPAQPLLSESLRWSGSPPILANVDAGSGGPLNVTVNKEGLPKDARVSCCLDNGKPVEMTAPTVPSLQVGWSASLPLGGVASGEHRVLVLVAYQDKDKTENVYRLSLPLKLFGAASTLPNWSVDLKSAIQGDALSDGEQVYVPTMSGLLFALDASTGKTRWQYQTGGSLYSAPARDSDTIYFGSCDGNVNALDRKTGGPLWKAAMGAPILAGTTVVGKVVCVPLTNGSIAGLDSASGHELWRTRDDGGMYRSRAATDGTHLLIGDGMGHFRCLDAATGQEVWNVVIGGGNADAPVAIASPTLDSLKTLVYVSGMDGSLHALSLKTGDEKWKVDGLALGDYSPALSSVGILYSASRTDTGQVYAFNHLTGAPLWSIALGSPIYETSCCTVGTNVCVGSVDGTFSALYGSAGAALGKVGGDVNWQYHLPPGHLLASPVADDISNNKQIYIGNLSGVFVAFPASTPTPTIPTAPTAL